MLAEYKRKANGGAALGFVAILIALSMKWFGWGGLRAAAVFVALGDLLFLWGCWCYARAKGHVGAWGLLVPLGFALIAVCWFYTGGSRGLLSRAGVVVTVVGLLLVAFLPDRN